MKNYLKNTWSSYAIALVLSYMLFIVEPINLFANNLNDFWFDLQIILGPSLLMFGGVFLAIVILSNIIYFVNKKVFKIYTIILFICFLCTYIQGNFLSGNLPVLSGDVIDWNTYLFDKIFSVVLWLIVIVATIIICKKVKMDNYIKYGGYITIAIFLMISVSLVSTILTTDVLDYGNKEFISTATNNNLDKYSNNKNFIIFLLDAVDSKTVSKSIEKNSEFKDTFKDFTYYPDTMSMHPFTIESIPLILTGETYKNQGEEIKFITDSMKNSQLLNNLYSKNYEVNIYESELFFYDKEALKTGNIVNEKGIEIDNIKFIKQELKYILFRYLPFFVKQYSKIETMDFNNTKTEVTISNKFSVEDHDFLEYMNTHEIKKESKNNFKFIHLMGAHVPFNFKKDLQFVESATYEDEVDGCLHLTDIYFNKLKESGVYDNSVIIVMADHGFSYNAAGSVLPGRQNPILFIKGINEKHNKISVSNKPISFVDLNDAYKDLLDNKNSSELFANITNDRTRNYLLYEYGATDHMEEYETKDKAWETDKLYKTGKEFNLK